MLDNLKDFTQLGDLISSSYFYLENKVDGRYLRQASGGDNVTAGPADKIDSATWYFESSGAPNKLYLVNKASGRYLDATQPPGNNVYANQKLSNENQTWSLEATNTENDYCLVNGVEQRYLDGTQPPGDNVYANRKLSNANQTWSLVPAGMRT